MSRRTWKQWFSRISRSNSRPQRPVIRRTPTLEVLSARTPPGVTAFFGARSLTVIGDANNKTIAISREGAGKLLVNGGAVVVKGGNATVDNTSLIQGFVLNGADTISLNEANG